MSAGCNQTFALLKVGNFVARVYTLRANYSVSPYLTFFNLIQFDNGSKNMGWQSRLRWILKLGDEPLIVSGKSGIRDGVPVKVAAASS